MSMKTLQEYLNETLNESKVYVKNNKLVDKKIQKAIEDDTIDRELANEVWNQYDVDPSDDNLNDIDKLDELSMDIAGSDYIKGETKGSIRDEVATILDEFGLDEWYFALLCIINHN